MEPERVLIFGLGFIILVGVTFFCSFKLQSGLVSNQSKNIINLLSFLFLAAACILLFKSYSQEFLAAIAN